jgi:hypothetical protein
MRAQQVARIYDATAVEVEGTHQCCACHELAVPFQRSWTVGCTNPDWVDMPTETANTMLHRSTARTKVRQGASRTKVRQLHHSLYLDWPENVCKRFPRLYVTNGSQMAVTLNNCGTCYCDCFCQYKVNHTHLKDALDVVQGKCLADAKASKKTAFKARRV